LAIKTEDYKVQFDATKQIRKLLSMKHPPIQEIIDANIVPRLVEFLKRKRSPEIMLEAAWALTNISSGQREHTKAVVQSGAVPLLAELLHHENEDVRQQCVWAIGNIVGDSPEFRDFVLKFGVMDSLLKLSTGTAKTSILRILAWTLSNLCRGKPQPDFEVIAPCLPALTSMLFCDDEEILTDACWGLSYISDDKGVDNRKIRAVIRSGVCRRLVQLMGHSADQVKLPALRTVGNIVTGDDSQTQFIIDCGCLQSLFNLLCDKNCKKSIRKDAIWTVSNITAGTPKQIQAVVDSGIFPLLVSVLRRKSRSMEFDTRKEAAWAISNATSRGSSEQIRYLVSINSISPLCQLLPCPDPKVVLVAMEGIENILAVGAKNSQDSRNAYASLVEECGGIELLEFVQDSSNPEIRSKCAAILTTYFHAFEVSDES
jgi:hypothetical protein